MISAQEAASGLERFVAASEAGKRIYYGPLYSANDLNGLAIASAPVTRVLPAGTISFFQTSINQTGQGFVRPLRLSETNLDGAPGQLPAGYEYLAASAGVFMPPQIPMGVKDGLTRHSAIKHVRHTTVWGMGASQFWPEGSFGHQSRSVATQIPNQLIQYGVNGVVGSRNFPEGGELHYPAGEVIRIDMDIYEPLAITVDGLAWNGGIFGVDAGGNGINDADGCLVYIVFEGWRFEALTA